VTGTVRVGILGCGAVARRHHLPWLARLRQARVTVVADRDPAALAAALELATGARGVGDWREAIDARDVDAVIVCLPNGLHAVAAEAAARRGLHMYVEKPLATCMVDAEKVVAACAEAGVVAMTGFNYRFNSLYSEARAIVASGRLGRIVFCRGAFTVARHDLAPWKRRRAEGGGVLHDLAPHHVDLSGWLLAREIVEAHGELSSRTADDDTATVMLRLDNGCIAQLAFAYETVSEERFEIYGQRGRLVVDRRRHQRAHVEAPGEGRLRRAIRTVRDARRVDYVLEKRRAPGGEPSHGAALREFLAAVRDGRAVEPGLEAGRACVAVLEAVARSAASGRWESVPMRSARAVSEVAS
jgi:predicted dehydrogenase